MRLQQNAEKIYSFLPLSIAKLIETGKMHGASSQAEKSKPLFGNIDAVQGFTPLTDMAHCIV